MTDEQIPRRDHLAEARTIKFNVNAIGRDAFFANGPTLISEGILDAQISQAESARVLALIAASESTIPRSPKEREKLKNEVREILGLSTWEQS